MTRVAPQRLECSVGETRVVYMNFTDIMLSTDTLSGTPTVVENTTTDLTLSGKALNSTTYYDDQSQATVAANCAVKFSVAGGSLANSPYKITITCSTSGGEVLKEDLYLSFV